MTSSKNHFRCDCEMNLLRSLSSIGNKRSRISSAGVRPRNVKRRPKARKARRWGADKAYGPHGHLVPVHSLRELARVRRADAVLLSPAFPTRSHPGGKVLGPLRWRLIAARSLVPVIAMGGIDAKRARRLNAAHWAGIDAFFAVNRTLGFPRILDGESWAGA